MNDTNAAEKNLLPPTTGGGVPVKDTSPRNISLEQLQRRAAQSWGRAITATDRNSEKYDANPTTVRQVQLTRSMKRERFCMEEYRRLGGKLPVR